MESWQVFPNRLSATCLFLLKCRLEMSPVCLTVKGIFQVMLKAGRTGLSAISDHQLRRGYEYGPRKGPGPALSVAADFQNFLNLWSIGPVGFAGYLTG
jgi:hypothetical protein